MLLTAEELLSRLRPAETVEVEVPEWGGTVRVRGLTAGGRQDLALRARGDEEHLARLIVSACLVEPRLSEEQVALLFEASAESAGAALDRIGAAISSLIGIGKDRAAAIRAEMFQGDGRAVDGAGGRDAGVPVPPGEGSRDDARATGRGDVGS